MTDDRVALLLRVTPEEREQIRAAARAERVTVQVYLERRALGDPTRRDRPRGRRPRPRQEALPLTG